MRNATVSGFLPEEREWMSAFLADGYTDSFRFLSPDTVRSIRGGATEQEPEPE